MFRLEDARRVITAAEKKAKEIGQPMNIAVADEGGNLVAHARMDGAWIGSIDISIKKASTSRAFDLSTKDLAAHSQSGGQFFWNPCVNYTYTGAGLIYSKTDAQGQQMVYTYDSYNRVTQISRCVPQVGTQQQLVEDVCQRTTFYYDNNDLLNYIRKLALSRRGGCRLSGKN